MSDRARDITIDVVIPVYNEELGLEHSVTTLRGFLQQRCPYQWRIVIADNASTDKTLEVAKKLSSLYSQVHYMHLDQKGRGRALRRAWVESEADMVSYMDVETISKLLDEINEDRSVPRNIRTSVQEAKDNLNDTKQDLEIRISNAISVLDSISNDPNLPIYTRTQIWNVVSMLEVINKSEKRI